MKTIVLDTNVILDRPLKDVVMGYEPCKIVLPLIVIEEIDRFKDLMDQRGQCARDAIRFLDELRDEGGSLSEGVWTQSGHLIQVELNHSDVELPDGLDQHKADNRIIKAALGLRGSGEDVTLVSQDICIRVIADACGLPATAYIPHEIDVDNLYMGWTTIELTAEEAAAFYGTQQCTKTRKRLVDNQYVILKCEGFECEDENVDRRTLARYCARTKTLEHIRPHLEAWNIKPAEGNVQQQFLMDALLDPDIALVTVMGSAGTGKTLLTLAAGLEQTLEKPRRYNKIIVSRALVPHGREKDIGALPGTKEEKLQPWMGPIFDNLEYLTSKWQRGKYDDDTDRLTGQERVWQFIERGEIELEALSFIRGRSIPKQFIFIDEAQNLPPDTIKTVITRAGQGTKVVLAADIEQIDNYRLTAQSNGFVYLVNAFKGQPNYAHVTLVKGERSQLAEQGVKLLK